MKNAGVTNQEKFEKYQELYETMKIRRLANIPRVNEEILINVNDKSYKVGIEILRKDDPFAMLVGEVKYTNCCQRIDDVGEPCMLHSINDGRVFCTYLIDEMGNKIMLSESWVWRCGNMICFDNIEGTSIMKDSIVYKDIVAACYKIVSERLINSAKENNDKIGVVSIGKGYDDLGLENYFYKKCDNNIKPKNYDDYRDSDLIYFVVGNQDMIDEYVIEEEIYSDERRIILQSGFGVTTDTISKIKKIEKNHKKEMIMYEYVSNICELAEDLETDAENIKILLGEDWYYIYSINDSKMYIHDLVRQDPVFKEETYKQFKEIRRGFYEILKESIIIENDNISLKEIEADLREDTSYILFLKQVRDGNIILLKENVYDYRTQEKIASKYDEPLKHIKEIRQNDRIIMHKVRFKVSDKLLNIEQYGKQYTK